MNEDSGTVAVLSANSPIMSNLSATSSSERISRKSIPSVMYLIKVSGPVWSCNDQFDQSETASSKKVTSRMDFFNFDSHMGFSRHKIMEPKKV